MGKRFSINLNLVLKGGGYRDFVSDHKILGVVLNRETLKPKNDNNNRRQVRMGISLL